MGDPPIKKITSDPTTFADFVEGEGPEMHPVLPEKKRRMNRHERRAMIKGSLSRDERLMIQELKQDLVKALVKPRNMTKAQLRRRRRKDAAR